MAQNEKEAVEQRTRKEKNEVQIVENHGITESQEPQEEVHKKGRKKKNQEVV